MTKRGSVLLLAVLLLAGLHLGAQANATGTLLGTVLDSSGAVVPGADVKITSRESGLARDTKTSGDGTFRFDLLPVGTYEVRITMTGFANAVYQNVGLAVGQATTLDVKLNPKTQTETVVVESAGVPLLDSTKMDVSEAVTPKMVEDLPLNGRDFVNLAALAPGARPVNPYDPTKARIGVFAINGSNGRNVNVTVNGIDDKDNTVGGPVMQLPLEAVQEMVVSTQRFSAANGRSEGALITTVTKAGTNAIHGSLYFFDRNEALNTNDKLSADSGQAKPPYGRQQFGGSIGGPVRKDKDFLFFAVEREREATNIVETPQYYNELVLAEPLGAQPAQTIPTPYFDWRYNGRWDHRINEKHNFFASYTNQNNTGLNDQSGGNSDLTAGNFTTNQLILASINLNSVLTPSVVNALTVGYQYWNNLIDSGKKFPTVTFASGEYFGTNGNVPQQSFQKKWQFKDDLSITRGRHTFKVGFDYLWEPTLGGFFEFTPTPAVTFVDDPSVILANKTAYPQGFATPGAVNNISETAGNPYFDLSTKMLGLYFQDDWKVSRRLTVNIGLRWDKDYNLVGGSAQGIARTYLELKAIGNPYAGIPHDDNKDFSPRIGFAYDLTGSGRHILRGGYGLYYGQIFENIPLFMVQQANPTIFATVLNLNSNFDPKSPDPKAASSADLVPGTGKLLSQWRYGVDPIPAPPAPPTSLPAGSGGQIMDPQYRNPYTQQSNIGYAFQIDQSNVIELDYVHVLGLHESKTVELNPKDPTKAGSPRVLNAALTAARQPTLAAVSLYAPIGRSRYDGLNVSYRRRLSRRFSLVSNYVFSKAVAYNGSAASFGNRPTDPYNWFAPHDFGPAANDERHSWVTSGVVELPWGFKFSPIMRWSSARPYSATQGVDYYGYGRNNEFAVVLNAQPTNLTATKSMSASQIQACLAGGTCSVSSFDSLRGQPFFQLDTRFSKTFKIKERGSLEFIFQAFDLTNRANFGNRYQGSIRSASFEQPTGFLNPSGIVIPHQFSGEAGFHFRF